MPEREPAVEIRVGAFMLASIATLAIGILWVLGALPAASRSSAYGVLMGTAAGIRGGDRVRVAGMEVGRVESVSLRPGEEWPILFEITLDSSILVTEEARAYITSDGLLTANYLEIDPGPPTAAPLTPGSAIQGSEGAGLVQALGGLDELSSQTTDLMTKLGDLADEISANVEPLAGRLEALLSDENIDSFAATLDSIRRLAEETRPRTNTLLEHLDGLVAELEESTDELPQVAQSLDELLAELRAALGADGERLAELLESAEGAMSAAGTTLEVTATNRQELERTLRDLQATMANLRVFSETLAERPSALVRKNRPPDRRPGEGNP